MTTAARKSEKPAPAQKTVAQSGEHVIGLDAMIRRSIEVALSEVRDEETDPQTTARMNPFDLEVALAEAKPSAPPEPSADAHEEIVDLPAVKKDDGVVVISNIPPAAVEIDRTK
jgi:hypothetical protein